MAQHTGVERRRRDSDGEGCDVDQREAVRRYLEALEARDWGSEEHRWLDQTASCRRDLIELEQAFVDVAALYTRRQRLTFAAWRAVGVPAKVLGRAGIRPKAG